MSDFISTFKKQFNYYRVLGERTLKQLSDEQFFHQFDETNNSAAILVSHLSGNIKSRWTNFRTEDGEKIWRKRDGEFNLRGRSREDLEKEWNEAWEVVENEMNTLSEENIGEIVYIRNEGHTVLQALFRQSNHLSYHVGQIVHQAKLLKTDKFECQSIPVGKSEEYFQNKMSEEKGIRNFTDRIWNKNNNKV